jgi:hypothetical protein
MPQAHSTPVKELAMAAHRLIQAFNDYRQEIDRSEAAFAQWRAECSIRERDLSARISKLHQRVVGPVARSPLCLYVGP